MYKVYAGDLCIYDDGSPLIELKVLDPTLVLEDSAAGSFEMTLLPGSRGYDAITPMVTEVKVLRDDAEIWCGRVLSYEEDFYNQRKMYCEGELAYLNDTCQEPQRYPGSTVRTFLEALIEKHNEKVDARKQFAVGMVTVSDDADETLRETGFEKTLELINGLVDTLGGHLRIRKSGGTRYLDYLKDYPNTASQTIEFGTNLVEFTRSWDYSELATVILPMGKSLEQEEMRVDVDFSDTFATYSYIDPETGRVIGAPGDVGVGDLDVDLDNEHDLTGYATAQISVEPGERYYYYGRMSMGYAAYALYDAFDFGLHSIEIGPTDDYRDYDGVEITIPDGVGLLAISTANQWGGNALGLKVDGTPEQPIDTYVTVKSVNQDGSYYVKSSSLMATYGWIEKQITWENVEDPAELYSKAMEYLTDNQFDGMTIEASAVDLHLIDNSIQAFDLLDQVRIISAPHGLDKVFPVTGISLPLADPKNVRYTFGKEKSRSLTGINNSINSDIFDALKTIVPKESLLKAAQTNATELIKNAALTNGYVTMVKSPQTGNVGELLIADDENYLRAQKVWRWNINGLGYSNTGYNGTFGLAITMDGQIVADKITTGTMFADRIRGGTLTLGGINNEYGVLTVLDKVGEAVGSWDKGGLFTQGRIVSYHEEADLDGGGNLDNQSNSSFTAIYGSRIGGYVGSIDSIDDISDDELGSAAQQWGELLLIDKDEKNVPGLDRITTLRGYGAVMLRGDSGILFRIGQQMVLITGWSIDNSGLITLRGRADWIVHD